jgi:hypothetical protein
MRVEIGEEVNLNKLLRISGPGNNLNNVGVPSSIVLVSML